MKQEGFLTPFTKIKQNEIEELNVRAKVITLLEENMANKVKGKCSSISIRAIIKVETTMKF